MGSIYIQNNKDKYIHFFSCCILVRGFERSTIYDIQRETIEFIPNTLIDFVEDIRGRKVCDVLEEYQGHKTAKEYLAFLEKKEFIFYSSNSSFPDLSDISNNEDTSEILFTTAIVSQHIYDNRDTFSKNIQQLGVKRLHLHIDNDNCMEQLMTVLSSLEYSRVSNISLSFPYQKIHKKVYENKRITSITLFNSPKKRSLKNNDIIKNYITCDDSKLFLTRFNLYDIAIGINAYNVAKNYNLALFKTIFIDGNGNIKYNFSDKNSYGNILDDFEKIRTNTVKKLSKLWSIKREEIEPCNVCEFRYCCTTTYIPVKGKTGYTVDCNYNPYTTEFN
jgi:SPASM domain peptide maturase of grasp-with-spasm system